MADADQSQRSEQAISLPFRPPALHGSRVFDEIRASGSVECGRRILCLEERVKEMRPRSCKKIAFEPTAASTSGGRQSIVSLAARGMDATGGARLEKRGFREQRDEQRSEAIPKRIQVLRRVLDRQRGLAGR